MLARLAGPHAGVLGVYAPPRPQSAEDSRLACALDNALHASPLLMVFNTKLVCGGDGHSVSHGAACGTARHERTSWAYRLYMGMGILGC
jgi:hypothetical protein